MKEKKNGTEWKMSKIRNYIKIVTEDLQDNYTLQESIKKLVKNPSDSTVKVNDDRSGFHAFISFTEVKK